MRIILVHFDRNLMGLSNSVRNIAKSGKSDSNYARLTEDTLIQFQRQIIRQYVAEGGLEVHRSYLIGNCQMFTSYVIK